MEKINEKNLFIQNLMNEKIFDIPNNYYEIEIDEYSVKNFLRYKKEILKYGSKNHRYTFSIDNNKLINLKIFTKNNPTILSLIFNRNGLVNFLSLESADNQLETKPFVYQGSIDTSNNRSYAYKIHRLIQMLDVLNVEANNKIFEALEKYQREPLVEPYQRKSKAEIEYQNTVYDRNVLMNKLEKKQLSIYAKIDMK